MPQLIRRGSRTKIETRYIGRENITVLIELGDGVSLGQFATAAEAKAHAESLLPNDRSAVYVVQHDNGVVTDWVRDFDEQRRQEIRSHWRNAFLTAAILVPVTAGAIAVVGVSPFSQYGMMLVAGSAGFYLFMRTWQNQGEGLYAWTIVFVLLMFSARSHSIKERKRNAVREKSAEVRR